MLAIGIGAVGALWNLWRFFGALFPGDGQDAWQLRAFPWLQVGNLLLGFVGLVLNVGVVMGGVQLRQGHPGGAKLLRMSALGLLAMTGLWFVGALVAMMGSDRWEHIQGRYQASAVAGLLGATLISALLASLLVVVSRKRPT
ncbi:MAG TPA: hypothetical protein VJ803_12015 [Gemmatimonadaceae bacterium]|jgi:hypothetical protein|nr:hypothetical protein [Gemmatimonadaceae bacterium]